MKQSRNREVLAFIGWTRLYEEYCQARPDEMLKLDAVK